MKLARLLLVAFFLFAAAAVNAGAQQSGGTATAPQTALAYVIHPGDQLSVQVFNEPTLTQTVTVLEDGTIDYPLIGKVAVAGKTPDAAARLLKSKLEKYVREPVVTVAIAQQGQPNVLVLGNVKNPGKYQIPSDGRLTDAIAAAGGLGPTDGDFPDARVSNAAGQVETVSLQKLLHDGDLSIDVPLVEGSVVYVPGPVTFNIEVVGAVDHPGEIPINQGDRLSMAIAKAGNSPNSDADLNRIRIVRTLPDGQTKTIQVDLYKALIDGQPQADVALQKGDVVYVPQAKGSKDVQRNSTLFSSLLYVIRRIGNLVLF